MNIKELKEAIENLPDEMEVILQKDSEGNGYSPLQKINHDAVYAFEDIYLMEWTHDDACMSKEEWEEIKSKPRVLVLMPLY